MDADRERAYNGAGQRPPQNLDASYRSRWVVNTVIGRRREQARPHVSAAGNKAGAETGTDAGVDLGPWMRMAQEVCWSRLLNRPRPCQAEL